MSSLSSVSASYGAVMAAARTAGSNASARSTSSSGSVAASIAAALEVDAKQLGDFEQNGGTVTFWQQSGSAAPARSGPADLGLPMTSEGVPDFDAIVAAGATVTGALPPNGAVMNTIVTQYGVQRIYAAQLDRGDGSTPTFIKSVGMTANSDSTTKLRQQFLKTMAADFQALPNSLNQARVQCPNGLLTWMRTDGAQHHLDVTG